MIIIKNIAIKSSAKSKQILNEYKQLTEGEINEYSNTFPYFDERSDETIYFSSRAKILLKDQQGRASLLFGIIEPEAIAAELYTLAKVDSLTGLYNRREFDAKIEFLLKLAAREHHYLSLIMCDIDYFKAYNDRFGHYEGDQCLIRVAQAIEKACARTTEVVCRYGGEEFCHHYIR